MGRALAYFRKVLKESGSQWARALMRERELFCGALGIPLAPYVPPREGANPLKVAPEGIRQSIGIMRTLSRIMKDAACVRCHVRPYEDGGLSVSGPFRNRGTPPLLAAGPPRLL